MERIPWVRTQQAHVGYGGGAGWRGLGRLNPAREKKKTRQRQEGGHGMEDAKQKEGYGWPDSGNEGAEHERLPRRLMSGRLEDTAKRGRGGAGRGARAKAWLDEVEKDVQAFDITGDWRQRATQAPEWHAAGTEGAQNLMDRWRAVEADKPSPVD